MPAAFRAALEALSTVRVRPEVVVEHIPAPQRLAPFAHAVGLTVSEPDGEAAAAFAEIARSIDEELAPTRRRHRELKIV